MPENFWWGFSTPVENQKCGRCIFGENEIFWFLSPPAGNILNKAGQGQGQLNEVRPGTNIGRLFLLLPSTSFRQKYHIQSKTQSFDNGLQGLTRPALLSLWPHQPLPALVYLALVICAEEGKRRLPWYESHQQLGELSKQSKDWDSHPLSL